VSSYCLVRRLILCGLCGVCAGAALDAAAQDQEGLPGDHAAVSDLKDSGLTSGFRDTDGDGMDDQYESFFGLDIARDDSAEDPDSDGLPNVVEAGLCTDPFVLDTDRDTWPDCLDMNPLSRAYIDWHSPFFWEDDVYYYPGPDWWLGAQKSSNSTWVIYLDRAVLTNDVVMQVTFLDTQRGALYVDVLDTNDSSLADDVSGNLVEGSGVPVRAWMNIHLGSHPEVSGLRLRSGRVPVTVYESLLYVDMDGNGLDTDQDRQSALGLGVIHEDYVPETSDGTGFISRVSATNESIGTLESWEERRGDGHRGPPSAPHIGIIYVDAQIGEDSFPGRSSRRTGTDGPKKTIRAGFRSAGAGSTVIIKTGNYKEDMDISGKSLTVVLQGDVNLSSRTRQVPATTRRQLDEEN